jgi:hypothetical protein
MVPALLASLRGASPLALSNKMVFDIQFAGGATNFSLPSLKVDFWANAFQTLSTGSLLSQSIGTPVSATQLPAALPLYATGLGALALLRWRRKRKSAASIDGCLIPDHQV